MNNSRKANAAKVERKERKEERSKERVSFLNKVMSALRLEEEDFDEEYPDEEEYLDEEEELEEEPEKKKGELEIIDLDDDEYNFLNKMADESEKITVKKVNGRRPISKKKAQAPEERIVVKKINNQPASKKAEKPTIISDWKVFAPGTLATRSMAGNELVRKVGNGEQISVVLKGTEQPTIISIVEAKSFGDYIKAWTDKKEVLYLES